MARVKSRFAEDRWVPWLQRTVQPGDVVDVADGDLESWLAGGWEPADRATKAAAKALAADPTEDEPTAAEPEPAGDDEDGAR